MCEKKKNTMKSTVSAITQLDTVWVELLAFIYQHTSSFKVQIGFATVRFFSPTS